MKLRLNLATAPLENHRRFIAGAGAIGSLALAALVYLSVYAYGSWQTNRDTRSRIAALERQISQREREQEQLAAYFRTPQAKQILDRSAFLNSLIEQRSFPWIKFFTDLERVLPPGVRVVSISPDMQGGRVQVKLTVGALSDEGKLRFLKVLENSRPFSSVQIVADKRGDATRGGDPIVLDLVAWYETL